ELCYADRVRAHHHPSKQRPSPAWRQRAEWRNNLLITWLRRPLRRCFRETGGLVAAALRDGDARAVLGGLLPRLPVALWHRRRLPESVEQRARLLERIPEASR